MVKNGTRDIDWVTKKLKLNYAGHVARGEGNWNRIIKEWTPWGKKGVEGGHQLAGATN